MNAERRPQPPSSQNVILGALLIGGSLLVLAWTGGMVRAACQNGTNCANADTTDSPGLVSVPHFEAVDPDIIGAYHARATSDLRVGQGGLGGWVYTAVDTAGSVGAFPSIARDDAGRLAVSYYDMSNGDLKVAVRDTFGVWTLSRVDSVGRVGLYTSIASVPNGFGVAYFDSTNGDLKYAERIGAAPWTVARVDSIGVVGMYASLSSRRTGGSRGISYYDATNGNLKFATRSVTWTSIALDVTGNVGGFTSQVSTPVGYGVCYYDFTNQQLKYAWQNAAIWSIQVVDSDGSVGRDASASAFGSLPGDSVAITYYDATRGDLKYAQKVGAWLAMPIDTAGNVGTLTACAAGPMSSLSILYHDTTNDALKVAVRSRVLSDAPGERRTGGRPSVSWQRSRSGPGGVVRYSVPSAGLVRLRLFDAQGRLVRSLLREPMPAGAGQVRWDGLDARGRSVPSGVLFIRIDTTDGSDSAPAVVMR